MIKAQEKFEITANAKMGYYFLHNEKDDPFYPENSFSPGLGMSLKYLLLNKTYLSVGIDANYLKPDMVDHSRKSLDVKWSSFNIPFEVQQGIGESFFFSGGVTLIKQISGYEKSGGIEGGQKVPEFNWQTGVGWRFKKFNLSLMYSRGFKEVEKMISTGSTSTSSSWFSTDIKHQEIYLKVEYSLWKF